MSGNFFVSPVQTVCPISNDWRPDVLISKRQIEYNSFIYLQGTLCLIVKVYDSTDSDSEQLTEIVF